MLSNIEGAISTTNKRICNLDADLDEEWKVGSSNLSKETSSNSGIDGRQLLQVHGRCRTSKKKERKGTTIQLG